MPPPPPQPGGGGRWPGHGLRNIGEFLSASFGLIVRSLMPLLPLLIAVAVPVVLSFVAADSALGLTDWFEELTERINDVQPGETVEFPELGASQGEVVTWLVILAAINIVGTVLVSIAGLVTLWAVHQGDTPSTNDILTLSARAFGPLLGLVLTFTALAFAGMFLLVLLFVALPPLGVIAILALFPLTFWLMARFSLAVPIAAIEHRGASSLRRSYEITAGQGWGVLGRLLLFSLILGFGVQIVSVPLSFLSFLGSAALAIGTILSFLVSLASSAIGQAGPIILYADLIDDDAAPPQTGWGQPI